MAYVPKSWSFEKFKNKMWETGAEVNKVTLSFLRQLLGVHKKTSNLAILGETGKYPLSIKAYIHIFKYWSRLCTSENELLKASKEANMALNQSGHQNWLRVIQYLLHLVDMKCDFGKNELENKELTKIFKQKIENIYQNWWNEKMKSTENRKLDFFFSYKKTFKFEPYLDAVPRNIRRYATRLRTSSHSYPVETLRYCKPTIDQQDRKCTICNTNQVGDEIHYLLNCTNYNILNTRKTHMKELRGTVDQFRNFSEECIIKYCLLLNDKRILHGMSQYIKAIAEAYKEETAEKPTIKPEVTTRYGRRVKEPVKLNL